MTYAEWKAKKTGQKTTAPSFDTSQQATTYEEWIAKKAAQTEEAKNEIYKRMQSLSQRSSSISQSFQNRFSGRKGNYEDDYVSDAGSWLDSFRASTADYETEADSLREYLIQNASRLDADFTYSINKALRTATKEYKNLGDYAQRDADNWASWESEDAYKQWQAGQKDYWEKAGADTGALKSELDSLNAAKKEYDNIQRQLAAFSIADPESVPKQRVADLKNRLAEITGQYGDLSSTAPIAEKQAYLTDAEKIQKRLSLENEAQTAADFRSGKRYEGLDVDALQSEYLMLQGELADPGLQGMDGAYSQNAAQAQERMAEIEQLLKYAYINEKNPNSFNEAIYRDLGLQHLTDSEKAVYNYYAGTEKAEEYLQSLQGDLNTRIAQERFWEMEDQKWQEMLFSIEAGLNQFGGGIRSMAGGEQQETSATQILSSMVREDLGEDGWKLPEALGGGTLWQVAYDMGTTTANMAPSILASVAANAIAPGSGSYVGNILLGASAAGNAYQEALNMGYDKGQAKAYSTLIGGSEALLGELLGGISALGGKVSGKAVTGILQNVDNALFRVAGKLGGSMASEFTEEFLQEVLSPWFQDLTLGTNNGINISGEALYSGLMGAFTAVLFEGANISAETVQYTKTGNQVKQSNGGVERLKNVGSLFAPETVAYKLAGKVDVNTDAYTIGRLFYEAGASMTEQNKADISQQLQERGVREEHAKTLTEVVAAVMDGEKLSRKQQTALEANDDLAFAVYSSLIDSNSTYYQRNRGYNDALMALAREQSGVKDTQTDGMDTARVNPTNEESSEVSKEMGAESAWEASVDGKAIRTDTGEAAQVKEIASMKDGKVKLRLEDGTEVDAKDVSYSSRGEALIYETVTAMTDDTQVANVLVKQFYQLGKKSALDAEIYAAGIDEAFSYGKVNIPTNELVTSEFASRLPEAYRRYAYRAGQRVAGRQTAREQATVSKKETVEKAVGIVHFDRRGRTFDNIREASLKTMEQLSAALGIDIHVYESFENKDGRRVYQDADGNEMAAPNGYYDSEKGAIYIDLNAGQDGKGTMLFTAAHELTHFIKQWSPAKFKVLANFLVQQYGEKGVSVSQLVERQMDKAKSNGRTLSWEDAFEEMVADSMETMLTDGNVVQVMADLKEQDRSLWQKISDWFKNLAADLQKVVDVYRGVKVDTIEGRMVADMQDVIVYLQGLYEDALADASENFQRAEKNTVPEGGVKYSLKKYTDHQKKNWATSKRIVVYSNVEQLAKFIQESIANKSMDKKMYFGAIPADLAAMIKTETGLDVENYNLSLGSYEIRKILKDHGVESKEAPRGQRAVVEDDFAHIVDVVLNPTNISLSEDQYMGKPAIIFTGSHNGRMNVVAVVSDKRLDLFVQTIYVNVKKEGNLATPTGDQAPANTPEANNGTVSSDSSIRNPGEEVNKKFSARDSEGKKLSQEQQEYFKDSKIRDSSGHLMPMYHGTLHGGFTVFGGRKDYWYFTKDRKYSYTFEGKKQNGHLYPSVKEGIEAGYYTPQRYKVYLNVTNPYVTDDVNIVEDALYWDRNLASKLREKGYDALILEDMSQVIVLNANQIKNVTNRKPTSNPDIHYSDRDPAAGRVNKVLQKENAQLKEDVRYLKELLKLQHTVTGGTKFTKSSLENMAGILMKANNVKGNRAELAGLLNGLYEYIAKGEELTWEGVTEMAQPAVEWLRRNTVIQGSMSEYAQDILRDIRTSRISLDDAQVEEAAYRYGSINDYRKSMMGSVVIAKDGVPLDTKWQEWASMYPDVFDPDTVATDMPGALADAISSLRNSDMSLAEYAYHADIIAQDLLQQVYDGYWRVSTLRTVADVKQKEINILKSKHYQRMNDLRQTHRENTEKLKQEHRAEMKRIREKYREASDRQQKEIMDRYDESRKKAVESRNRTAMRHKIQNVVKELNDLLLNESKKRHVPDSLKKAVADALELVNMDTVGAEERAAKYAALIAREEAKVNPDQDKIDAYTVTKENILRQGEKMKQRLTELRAAYEEIQKSDDPDIANAYDPVIAESLEELSQSIGNTSLRDMTIEQLSDVYDMYRMVLTRVRDSNKTLLENIKESISNLASSVIGEVRKAGGEHKYRLAALDPVTKFMWNNLKPVYAMEHIGSATLSKVFDNVRAGEDTWAMDVTEAREYYLEKSKKYGYDSWDFDKKYRFESASGLWFELTLEQILSLYAYSKRDQAHAHLRLGGFVFDSNIETYKDKEGKLIKYKVNTADAHQINHEILADIIGTLTDKQKGFVDEMQDYLSTVMGAKGNEVTMKMYGVKLFKEKFYFPLKSAKHYMFEQNEVSGEVKIKNSGFTNKVKPEANNPVILSNFMDVWSGHVNDMSMYHAFVLPLEDFNRVFNYNSPKKENQPSVSVKGTIQNAYSPAAVSYVKNLITALNGGARVDSTAGFMNKMIGKFKKGAVFASLSVIVQQPSAIARAAALVDTKYFIGPKIDKQRHKLLWEEVKKYAPVAVIKEMGYFDTNMGKSTKDFITGKEYTGFSEKMKALVQDSHYRDEVLSKLPALADEWAWSGIWEAVKRETAAKYSKMDTKSDAFLKLVGERFTEVIVKTQVYDSVLSRSAMMRSKESGMKMLTAFMAEPTTSINMVADALLKGKRGNVKYCRTAIGAVIASQILNSILVSFVYAARDDDEDKTYTEKYLSTLTAEVFDSLNPATYIPFVKDIVSICQGYTVERSDMAIISDLYDGYQALKSSKKTPYEKVEKFAGSWAQLFGLPLKNIMRDTRAMYRTITAAMGEKKNTSAAGIGYAIKSGLPGWLGGGDTSNQEQLYAALIKGDAEHIQRVAGRYEDQAAAESAMRSAIKAHYLASDISAKTATQYMVRFCSMTEDEAYWKIQEWDYAAENGSAEGYAKYDDFLSAVKTGKNLKSVIQTYTDNGVELKTLKSQITGHYKPRYITMTTGEKANIKGYLLNAMELCGDTRESAMERLSEWEFESKYGFENNDMKRVYMNGQISSADAVKILMEHRGYDQEYAQDTVSGWQFEADYPELVGKISFSQYQRWEAEGKPNGVSVEVFTDVAEFRDDGSSASAKSQEEVAAYINSLNISKTQKDALWCCFWKESTLYKAPWR